MGEGRGEAGVRHEAENSQITIPWIPQSRNVQRLPRYEMLNSSHLPKMNFLVGRQSVSRLESVKTNI
jgi:hypothetical protein